MRRTIGWMLALLLTVTGVAHAAGRPQPLYLVPQLKLVQEQPSPYFNDDCEIGVRTENTWAWSYAIQQFGLEVEYMQYNNDLYLKLKSWGK